MDGKCRPGCPALSRNSSSRKTCSRAAWSWNTMAKQWRLLSSVSASSRLETGWGSSGLGRGAEQPVPVVPLTRLVAQVADEPLHVGRTHTERGAGLADHVLFDHDAAEIVRAILQRDLSNLRPLGDPGALDVGNVIEVNARQRLGPEVFVGADGGGPEFGVLGLKRPGDERGETLAAVLLRPHSLEVFNAFLDRFDVAEHHGGGGSQS